MFESIGLSGLTSWNFHAAASAGRESCKFVCNSWPKSPKGLIAMATPQSFESGESHDMRCQKWPVHLTLKTGG